MEAGTGIIQPTLGEPAPTVNPCNFTATTNPTASDDLTAGYGYNSIWYRTDTEQKWTCVDPTIGGAFWVQDLTEFSSVSVDAGSIFNINSPRLLGRYSAGLGYSEQITIGSGLALSGGGVLSASGGGSGTVTSVGISLPLYSFSGSPVTTSGTLTGSLSTQSANTVLAGPTSGGSATPAFRAPVAADIPNLDTSKLTSGTLATARLGSGTANSASWLRGDQTWGNPLTIGNAVASGGANRLLFEDSSQNLSSDSTLTFASGALGVGIAAAAAKAEIRSTTEQLRLSYDGSNYGKFTVGSAGLVSYDAVGSAAQHTFNKQVNCAEDFRASTVGNGYVVKSPDATEWRITVNNLGVLVTTAI